MFGTAPLLAPQAGLNGVATIAPMIIGEVFVNAGMQFNTNTIVDCLPERKAIGDFVIQNVADTVI